MSQDQVWPLYFPFYLTSRLKLHLLSILRTLINYELLSDDQSKSIFNLEAAINRFVPICFIAVTLVINIENKQIECVLDKLTVQVLACGYVCLCRVP